jgi:RNA polymerase sigma-70 factor (ECF subfamily)
MSQDVTNSFSENELISEIKEGNKNAFQELFYQYSKKLIEFSYFRTKNLEASKDLVQEMFASLWINRNRLDPQKSIKAYLYKAITNRIINLSKHSSFNEVSFDESISQKKAAANSDIENRIDLFSAIDHLPEKCKTVFMLSRIEGFKYSEIAEITEISVKAVEKRMSKALKILRKQLSN